MSNTASLKKEYAERIAPALMKQFNYSSAMQVPVLKKIVINEGLGAAVADRTNELPGREGFYNEHNLSRGNEKNKDWYNFFGITITTKLSNGKRHCL